MRGRTLEHLIEQLAVTNVQDLVLAQQNLGTAGFFNRIGLTGIPLAVAILSLVLYALFFIAKRADYSEGAQAFLEMAKLTTGAFIGALSTKELAKNGHKAEK